MTSTTASTGQNVSAQDQLNLSQDVLSSGSGTGNAGGASKEGENLNVPKPKRLACMICRKRKLKCDGGKPSCSTCARLGHACAYDEVRRKSGPKRGYVKALEERLKQVETLLKTQEPITSASTQHRTNAFGLDDAVNNAPASGTTIPSFSVQDPSINIANDRDMDRWRVNPPNDSPQNTDDFNFNTTPTVPITNASSDANNFTWEMIGLGLEEPLPPQETIDELHQLFFQKISPTCPIIHKFRYLAAMNLAPSQRPPVCLRYAIWTLACSITDKYHNLKDLFYQRARKYLEADYIKGHGEHIISVSHAQTHILLAEYELKMMYFPRAWVSTGSGVRLCQMMGLHRLDGTGLDVKQCVPPPRDWTEREERRRTFWMAFCEDRYASIGTGWPMTIDENDILTNLPSSDEAFEMSRPEQTQSLQDSMSPSGASKLSSFGGIVLMACLFGKNLIHLHRPDADDRNHDLNGEFWKRHRHMDNILLNTSLCLPAQLKLPAGLSNANVVFTNMCIHTSTICLHQAAIFTADKHRLPASVSAESKIRCITAANEIASIMRMISHMDLSSMNPFLSFCLYVAARVFVQYLKSLPDDSKTVDSLRFLLSAMNALKRRNPLTESFLVQLDVDLEALGMRIPKLKALFPRSGGDSPNRQNSAQPCTDQSQTGKGIMKYRNECHFMKATGDDGNPSTAPNMVTPEQQDSQSSAVSSGQHWSQAAEHPILATAGERSDNEIPLHNIALHPDTVPIFESGTNSSALSDSNHDMAVSPDPSASNRPTPSSSSASEHRHNLTAPSSIRTSGGSPFAGSPDASRHGQNLPMGGVDSNIMDIFGNSGAFNQAGAGVQSSQRFSGPNSQGEDFTMQNGWEMPSTQPGMTPVAEGVLRNLMQMGSLEMMDMGWDTGT